MKSLKLYILQSALIQNIINIIGKIAVNFVSSVDVKVILGVCCCSEKLIDATVKSDYFV